MSRWCLGLFASAVSTWCLHRLGMFTVAPKLVLRGCFRLFYNYYYVASKGYVDSKGDVKQFFGLRFGRFSARVQMVFRSFCICSVQMVFA